VDVCELLRRLVGEGCRVYPYGEVVVVARSEKDIRRFLYASTFPRSIDPARLPNALCGSAAVETRIAGNELRVVVSDIASGDAAMAIAHAVASRLSRLGPLALKRVDAITSLRACEDGGFEPRNQVVAVLRPFVSVDEVKRLVEDALREVCG